MSAQRPSVAEVIAAANRDRAGALIGYLPVGYPDTETSVKAAIAMAKAGVDVIELGVPYSDPVMDGPVIQQATTAALEHGFKLKDAFAALSAITDEVSTPVLLMTYWNPVLQYGVERFARDLATAGGAGLITPDLIPDEASEWLTASDEAGLERIFLASPSSSDQRLSHSAQSSRGFVYVVSTMGITGARSEVDSAARILTERLRNLTENHLCIGLGISTAQQVAEVLEYADGAIVGSALVRALQQGGVQAVSETAAMLASGTHKRP